MRTLLTLAFAVTLCSIRADAASIQLVQTGWEAGGVLDISFLGDDLDRNGALLQTELSMFHAAWSTPAGVSATWSLSDIEPDGFFFIDPAKYLLFTRGPEFSLVSGAFEGEALASVFDQFLFPVDSTSTPPVQTP